METSSQANPSQAREAAQSTAPAGTRVRSIAYPVLVVLGTLFLLLGNLLIWMNSSVFDSSNFSQSVENVLAEPQVQERIAQVLAAQAVESGDVKARVDAQLPTNLSFLAPLITRELEPVIQAVAQRILASDAVQSLTGKAVLTLHQRLVDTLEGNKALAVQGDRLELDLNDLLTRAFDDIGVTPPQRLDQADLGKVVIVDDARNLKRASLFMKNRQELTWALLLVSVACFGAAVLLGPSRRRGLRASGYGVLGAGLLGLLLVLAGRLALSSVGGEHIVAKETYSELVGAFRWQSLAMALLGACIICVADSRILEGLNQGSAKAVKWAQDFGVGKVVIGAAALIAIPLLVF